MSPWFTGHVAPAGDPMEDMLDGQCFPPGRAGQSCQVERESGLLCLVLYPAQLDSGEAVEDAGWRDGDCYSNDLSGCNRLPII